MLLNSLEHCICTTTMTNIRPDRDSNLVPLRLQAPVDTNEPTRPADFPVIEHIKVKRLAILNLIRLKTFAVYSHLKPHIMFNTNGLAMWHGFPVIMHIKVKTGRRSAILKLIMLNFFHGFNRTFC